MSSSLANRITALALGLSLSRRTILSNSPVFGSRGIFTDWAIHTLPVKRQEREKTQVRFSNGRDIHICGVITEKVIGNIAENITKSVVDNITASIA